jgi:hypothetical protein
MKQLLKRLWSPRAAAPLPAPMPAAAATPIVIVSGLPRSGTSMMMKILEAGGQTVVIDGLRAADPDNPEGYYELERVKELDKGDTAWVHDLGGKAVKVISALLEYLPPGEEYRVVFMHRQIDEVLRSQRKMLAHRGEMPPTGAGVDDTEMANLFARHVEMVQNWLAAQPNFSVLEVQYNALLQDPQRHVAAVNRFLGGGLDEARMAAVINPDLYRNRA